MIECKGQINYNERNKTCQTQDDNYERDLSISYLTFCGCNASKASSIQELERLGKSMEILPHYVDAISRKAQERKIKHKHSHGIFRRIINFLKGILSCSCVLRNANNEKEKEIFEILPNVVDNMNSFISQIKTRIGIIFIYTSVDMIFLDDFIEQIESDQPLLTVLRNYCAIYPILLNSPDGKIISSSIHPFIKKQILPLILFAWDQRDQPNLGLASIIGKLEGKFNVQAFKEVLMKNIDQTVGNDAICCDGVSDLSINGIDDNNNSQGGNDSHQQKDFDSQLIKQQIEEIKALERGEEEKERQYREAKLREIVEKKLKEEMMMKRLKQLPPEPEVNNFESTLIIFRRPDENKRFERRFLKSERVKVIYDYVSAVDIDTFTGKFELLQSFPYKVYIELEKTLEEENLYPNIVLQIKLLD